MSIFGNAATSSSNKIEFKAGRMTLVTVTEEGVKKTMVHSDKR